MITTQQKYDNIAMIAIIIISIFLFVCSCGALKNIDVSCPSSIIREGWTALLAISASLATAGFAFFICSFSKGAKCYEKSLFVRSTDVYFISFILIGIAVVIVSSAMVNRYSKDVITDQDKSSCGSRENKKLAVITLVMACLIIVISGVMMVVDNLPEKEAKEALNPV